MKISIVSSMDFAEKIIEIKRNLEKLNHHICIPPDTYECLDNPNLNMDLDFLIQEDLLMKCFNRVCDNEAILVLNYQKGNIKGYVGGASLMEIGVAYFLKKKIYILNDLPNESDLRYVCEIKQCKPIILKGNLNLIN
jgi:hypothetical protein